MSEETFLSEMIEKYPHVFAKKAHDLQPFPMFGIECGTGWYTILRRLFAVINNHLEWTNRNEEKLSFYLTQIKEKYGTLRFYYDGGDAYIDGMVQMAEAMSGVTCEICGNPGKVRGSFWVYTACETHTREEDKNEV